MRGSSRTCLRMLAGVSVCGGATVRDEVVQTPSPWAMVASRCTCVPSSREKTSVSASHSCGNSLGDVRDRAVVLAQLLAPLRMGRAARRSSVPVGAQGLGEGLGALLGSRGRDRVPVRPGLGLDAGPGERRDGFLAGRAAAGRLLDPVQGVDGELVVGLLEGVPAAVGEGEDLGRAAAGRARRRRAARAVPTTSSATSASRWRRTAAWVRPRRFARSCAVEGPWSRIERATRLRVDRSPVASSSWGASPTFFTTPLLRNSSGPDNPRRDHERCGVSLRRT